MTQEQLISELKAGVFRRVYYLHGKEIFYVLSYARKIADKALEGSTDSSNFVKFTGLPNMSDLADFINSVSFFDERRVVLLNDLDAEKADKDALEQLCSLLGNVPDSVSVIVYATGFVPDVKKAKTKKLIAAIEGDKNKHVKGKAAAILHFEKLTEAKIAESIEGRAAKAGCSISRANAVYLSQLCLRDYTLIVSELAKLCAYCGYSGEITRKAIDLFTTRQLESVVFALAGEITAKRGANAMKLLDELLTQGNAPVMIVATLSMTFVDLYRAKIATATSKREADIARDFAYAANRTWGISKAVSAAARLSAGKLRECVCVLCDADFKLKSSPSSITDKDRLIMERTIARLVALC
ncbi:MAG: DNA polymerase III subunit delta [Oscillospiraceae bacterium]|nr:DNA polymerase III subunit delta [Oscillospiraceae bacterium]